MMTWNHRILRHVHATISGKDEISYGIHEVYYDDDKNPDMCTTDAVGVWGDNLEELAQTLERMRKSLKLPILDYADFDEGGKYYTGNEE